MSTESLPPAVYTIDGEPVTAEEAARRALIETYFSGPDDVLAAMSLDDVLAALRPDDPSPDDVFEWLYGPDGPTQPPGVVVQFRSRGEGKP